MFSNPRNELRVSQAWETLLSGGELPSGAVRTLVDQSWQRCAQAQVDPLRRRGALPVSEQDLYLLHERQKDLLEAAAPVMACARDYLAETGMLMALSDAHGTILVTEGDHPALDAAQAIALVPGVTWSEVACGTNAIGTALAAQRPAQIHAAEHFCAGIQGWTCSAALVRHPLDGELLGSLDVSGLSATYHRQSLAFVINTASRIEARLAMVEMERRYRLLDHALGRWSADGQDAMVLFDRRGCPIKASAHAQRAIEALGGGLDLSGQQGVPSLRAGRWRRGMLPAGLPAWLRGEWLEPLVVRGEQLGTLLVLPGRSSGGAHGARGGARNLDRYAAQRGVEHARAHGEGGGGAGRERVAAPVERRPPVGGGLGDQPAQVLDAGQRAVTGHAFPQHGQQDHRTEGGTEAGPGIGHQTQHAVFGVSGQGNGDQGHGQDHQAVAVHGFASFGARQIEFSGLNVASWPTLRSRTRRRNHHPTGSIGPTAQVRKTATTGPGRVPGFVRDAFEFEH